MFRLFFFLYLTLVSYTSFSNTWLVTSTADSGPGSLRDAVLVSGMHDTIRFSPMLLSGANDTIKLVTKITITKPLVFKGLYNSTDTLFISGQNNVQIFDFDLMTSPALVKYAVLDSLCLIEGYSIDLGGAVVFEGDSLYVFNSVFTHNYSDAYGGALYVSSPGSMATCLLEIYNSKFYNNEASRKGGAFMMYSPHYAVFRGEESVFNYNLVSFNHTHQDCGGGAFLVRGDDKSEIDLINSEVKFNHSEKYGGGIYAFSGDGDCFITITGCDVSSNYSANLGGGGLASYCFDDGESTINISYSTFAYNTANAGGGVYSYCKDGGFSTVSANYSTFAFNNALTGGGGGIFSYATWNSGWSDVYSTVNSNYSTFNDNHAGLSGVESPLLCKHPLQQVMTENLM